MKRIVSLIVLAIVVAAPARAQTTDAVLDTIQHRAFNFFWSEANAANGLIRDRSQPGSPASIASVGFGLSSIAVGIDRGWITRIEGSQRVFVTLSTFWNGPQNTNSSSVMGYKGFYYHFLTLGQGYREWSSELSSIDTALLLAGVIDAKQYFTGDDFYETNIRALADSIYYRVDWQWMRDNYKAGIKMGWKPGGEGGFTNFGLWQGYNEAMIMYVLALGSPTHAVPDSCWNYWTSSYNYGTQYGQTYVIFPPLFGHQYSHCWIDFRGIRDLYMRNHGLDYFENSRRATLAQRQYAITNPLGKVGYADSLWGLTASDTPTGYAARGAPPIQNDDGTITPTAPLGSIPFAPTECLKVTWKLWNSYRNSPLWGPCGFRDAFNLTKGLNGTQAPPWYDPDYIGIDEGPIVLMIENYRTGSVWDRFMRNADVLRGLNRAGFQQVVDVEPRPAQATVELVASPNPFATRTTLRFRLAAEGSVKLRVLDVQGREVARLVDGVRPAGWHTVDFEGGTLRSGVYHVRLETAGRAWQRKCLLVR